MVQKWHRVIGNWPTLTFYQRFESVVALALTFLISLVIIVALFRLVMGVVAGLVVGAMNPLDHVVFQKVFGEILTLLIALEFNHTLQYVATRQQTIIQAKIVLLIAVLALARKFIVMDLTTTSPQTLYGLAAVTVALGVTYWFTRDREERVMPPPYSK